MNEIKNTYPWGNKEWTSRSKKIAEFVPEGASVIDLGGGFENLKKHLSAGSYISVDKAKWTPQTIVADFNKIEFPELEKRDCVVCQGILEYIKDPMIFLRKIQKYGDRLILTYRVGHIGVKGRLNDFEQEEVIELLVEAGWKIMQQKEVRENGNFVNERVYFCKKV